MAAHADQASAPRVLSLNGTTSFVPAATVRVRAPFDCRIDRVLVNPGSHTKKGDPLLELSSTDLAEARSNYEAAISHWIRDKYDRDHKRLMVSENSILKAELIDAENSETQSLQKMKLARDRLLAYGLSDQEIDEAPRQDRLPEVKMTQRSPADGIVVQRSAVLGNYYDRNDTLLVIAGIDELQVIARAEPRDAGQLKVGQPLTVKLPFSNRTLNARVEAIHPDAEPGAGTVSIRATIPNPDHGLKAGVFVRLEVDVVPSPRSSTVRAITAERKSSVGVEERLNAVERDLERLLEEKDARSANEEIRRRLIELERKLDRVLDRDTGK